MFLPLALAFVSRSVARGVRCPRKGARSMTLAPRVIVSAAFLLTVSLASIAQVYEPLPRAQLIKIAEQGVPAEVLRDIRAREPGWSLEQAFSGKYYERNLIVLPFKTKGVTKHYVLFCWLHEAEDEEYFEFLLLTKKHGRYVPSFEWPCYVASEWGNSALSQVSVGLALKDVTGDRINEVLFYGGPSLEEASWLTVFSWNKGHPSLISPCDQQLSSISRAKNGKAIIYTELATECCNLELVTDSRGGVEISVPAPRSGHYNEDKTDYIIEIQGPTKQYRYEKGKIVLFKEVQEEGSTQ
jgi:hypothetical protein